MLDPLTALGLVGNILQIVEFGLKTVRTGRELAATGTTEEYERLERLLRDSQSLFSELCTAERVGASATQSSDQDLDARFRDSGSEQQRASEQALRDLAGDGKVVVEKLSYLLDGLKIQERDDAPSSAKRIKLAARRAVKGAFKEKEVEKLKCELRDLQQRMLLRVSNLQWYASVRPTPCLLLTLLQRVDFRSHQNAQFSLFGGTTDRP